MFSPFGIDMNEDEVDADGDNEMDKLDQPIVKQMWK